MRVYTPIRWVPRMVGRGLRGNRLLFGPYNVKREAPVALGGIFGALSVALAGAAAGGIRVGLVLSLTVAPLILIATTVAIAYIRAIPTYPPLSVRAQARVNQWRRKPVFVSGRGATPPPTVIAGGKVGVRP